jgi:hypothetical protein
MPSGKRYLRSDARSNMPLQPTSGVASHGQLEPIVSAARG